METKTVTYRVELAIEDYDSFGYINYVFNRLDHHDFDDEFLLCTRFPNWEQKFFKVGDIGFVTVRYVQEGVDKWYDGKDLNFYKKTNLIFLKFIPLKSRVDTSEIILD
jgi:hypothetical protein